MNNDNKGKEEMSKIMTLRMCRTKIYELEIDLDEWYSFKEMNAKKQHAQIQSIIDDFGELIDDDSTRKVDEDIELLDWDLS